MEIAVVGGQEFTLGFRLAGIRKVVDVEDNPELVLRSLTKALLKAKQLFLTSLKLLRLILMNWLLMFCRKQLRSTLRI